MKNEKGFTFKKIGVSMVMILSLLITTLLSFPLNIKAKDKNKLSYNAESNITFSADAKGNFPVCALNVSINELDKNGEIYKHLPKSFKKKHKNSRFFTLETCGKANMYKEGTLVINIGEEYANYEVILSYLDKDGNVVQKSDLDFNPSTCSFDLDRTNAIWFVIDKGEELAPIYNLPEYAYNPLGLTSEQMQGRYGVGAGIYHCNWPSTENEWNMNNLYRMYPESCTYYTSYKLHERGIEYPTSYGCPGNGGEWVRNIDPELKYVLPYAEGCNALYDLMANNNKLDNIVVSFDNGTGYGHVMLIDHAVKDENGNITLTFSDNYNLWTGKELFVRTYYGDTVEDEEDLLQKNDVTTTSIEDFITVYRNNGGCTVNGAVCIGRTTNGVSY